MKIYLCLLQTLISYISNMKYAKLLNCIIDFKFLLADIYVLLKAAVVSNALNMSQILRGELKR